MEATERFGWVTGRIEASGQGSAFGRAATLQAVTRVKLEQASKVKLWMPTRPLFGEGRAAGKKPTSTWPVHRGSEHGMQGR
jgi:hypothetical protein